jgi:hypothetical protein
LGDKGWWGGVTSNIQMYRLVYEEGTMVRAFAIVALLSFAGNQNSFANDSDRIDLLEREIRDLKIRISKLEAPSSTSGSQPVTSGSNEKWMSITNWRKLTTSMGPNDVRKILGEPSRLDGGIVAYWYYQNGGKVTFVNNKVSSWEEPEE